MWYALMLFLAILSGLSCFYLLTRFHRFSFVEKIGEKHRFLSWLLAAAPVALILLWNFFNVTAFMVVALHFMLGFALCGLARFIIRKAAKKEIKYDICGAVAIALTVVYLSVGWFCAHHVFRTEYTFYTEKELKSDLKLAVVSDSHLGVTLDGEGFADLLKRIEKEKPDALLVAGDFVDDDSIWQDMRTACAALGKMKTKYGVFFVLGNHDEGYFNYRDFTLEDLTNALTENRVKILEDVVYLCKDEFYVIGRRDRSAPKRLSAEKIVEMRDSDRFTVMLDHQPNDFEAEAKAAPDLVICGHTHGGHVFPAGLFGLITGANDKVYGHERRGNTDFVVTSGVSGWAIPFKTGCYSEYVIINVKKK